MPYLEAILAYLEAILAYLGANFPYLEAIFAYLAAVVADFEAMLGSLEAGFAYCRHDLGTTTGHQSFLIQEVAVVVREGVQNNTRATSLCLSNIGKTNNKWVTSTCCIPAQDSNTMCSMPFLPPAARRTLVLVGLQSPRIPEVSNSIPEACSSLEARPKNICQSFGRWRDPDLALTHTGSQVTAISFGTVLTVCNLIWCILRIIIYIINANLNVNVHLGLDVEHNSLQGYPCKLRPPPGQVGTVWHLKFALVQLGLEHVTPVPPKGAGQSAYGIFDHNTVPDHGQISRPQGTSDLQVVHVHRVLRSGTNGGSRGELKRKRSTWSNLYQSIHSELNKKALVQISVFLLFWGGWSWQEWARLDKESCTIVLLL